MHSPRLHLLDRECRSKDRDAFADPGDPSNPDRLPGRWRDRWIGQQGRKEVASMKSFILVLLTAATLQAQTGARFTASSANVRGAGEAIKIAVTEWSPDSRR